VEEKFEIMQHHFDTSSNKDVSRLWTRNSALTEKAWHACRTI